MPGGESMSPIKVAVVEDHELTREVLLMSLRNLKEVEVVGDAATGTEGVQLILRERPDVAIVDLGLPKIDGIEVTRQIKASTSAESESSPKVIILTLQDHEEAVLAAFAAGADSYCMKDEAAIQNLQEVIQLTAAGQSWIDPKIAGFILEQTRKDFSDSGLSNCPLTSRELEVLQLIVDGCSNAAIAEKLYISLGTVKTHVRHILNKLSADDRTQAAVHALRSGYVQ